MAVVGRASVVVRALTDKFRQDLQAAFKQAERDADASGKRAGSRFGAAFRDGVNKQGPLVDFGDVGDNAELAGLLAGARFRQAFEREVADIRVPTPGGGGGGGGSGGGGSGGGGGGGDDEAGRREAEAGDSGGRAGRNFLDAFNKGASSNGGPSLPAGFISSFMVKLVTLLPIITTLVAALSALVSGIYAVASSAAVAATGGLALLPGLIGGLVAIIGVGVLAFKGLGDAVKELGEAQSKGAKLALQHARSERAAARAIKSAAEGVEDAQERLADAHERVQDALENLDDARRDAARGAQDAARRVLDAEDRLAEAQEDARDAQERLTDAREDAKETLEDLQNSLRGSVLSEEEAVLRLERARREYQETLNDADADANDRAQARIDLQQAELALDMAKDRREDLTKQTIEANKAGIEGSDEVVAAKERIDDANESVADAERDLARAREDQTRQAVDAAERIQDAQESVRDAYEGVEDATEGVAEAQERLADAYRNQAETVAANRQAQADLLKEFNKLSPAGQRLAKYMNSLRGQFKELKTVAQEGVLSGFHSMLQRMMDPRVGGFFQTLKTGIGQTAETLGNFFRQLGRTFTAPAAIRDLKIFFDSNSRVMEKFGHAFAAFLRAGLSLAAGVAPYMERFAEWIDRAASRFSNFIDESRDNGELTKFMDLAVNSAKALGDAFGALFDLIKVTAIAAAPFGNTLLHIFAEATRAKAEFFKTEKGQSTLRRFFSDIVPNVRAVVGLLGALGAAFLRVGQNPAVRQIADQLRTEFVPALEDLINKITTNWAPQIFSIITSLTEFLRNMADSVIFQGLLDVLQQLAGALSALSANPWIREFIAAVVVIGGALFIFHKLVKVAEGIGKVWKALGKIFYAVRVVIFNLRVAFMLLRVAMLANPVGAVIAVVALLVGALVLAWKNSETFRNVVKGAWESIGKAAAWVWEHTLMPVLKGLVSLYAWVADKIISGAILISKALGIDTSGLKKAKRDIESMKDAVHNGFELMGPIIRGATTNMDKLSPAAKRVKEQLERAGDSSETAARKAKIYERAQGELKTSTKKLKDELQKVIDKFSTLNGDVLSQEEANSRLEESFDTMSATIKENGRTLDVTTEQGRANRSAIIDAARAVDEKVKADLKANASTKGETEALRLANIQYAENRERLIAVARQSGLTREQADKFVTSILKTPAQVKSEITTPGIKKAQEEVDALGRKIKNLPKMTDLEIQVEYRNNVLKARAAQTAKDGIERSGYAFGGRVRGPGGPTDDKVPAWLSNGEFVVKAAMVDRYGPAFFHALNAGRFASGGYVDKGIPKFASGGAVNISLPPKEIQKLLRAKMADDAVRFMNDIETSKTGPRLTIDPKASASIVSLGRQLQGMGFRVSEHPAFGGVQGKHSATGYHYRGRAIDVNYGPPGESDIEKRAIDAIMPQLRGMKVAELLWRTKNHFDHLHVAMAKGGTVLPRPGGTLALLGEAGRAESVVDTGLLNARLRTSLETDGAVKSELQTQTALLRQMARLAGINIENYNFMAAPEEGVRQSLPRAMRDLTHDLGT